MPLTKGLRDEENERIDNILKQLIALSLLPDSDNDGIEKLLSQVALSRGNIDELTSEELISQLQKMHFDWSNAEQFADFVLQLSKNNPLLIEKAIAIYEYVQDQSQTFSFAIFNKINTARK